MLTPLFRLSQTDDVVTVHIRVPYAKLEEIDIYHEDFAFKFYCKPYFLRLNLPGKVLHCGENPNFSYNVEESSFKIHMPKATKGEIFQGLDLLTRLLAPKKSSRSLVPKIEVVGKVNNHADTSDDEDSDWEIEQTLDEGLGEERKCGFGNMYNCYVFKLKEEASEIFDIKDADKKSPSERRAERLETESQRFNAEHYMADLYDNEEILTFIDFEAEWDRLFEANKDVVAEDLDQKIELTAEDYERLIKLLNKEYIFDKSESRMLLFGLADILYGFAYDRRTTQGEGTVESGWNINKISAVLSWLEEYTSPKMAVDSVVRRSLIYPYARNWDLSMKVLQDVVKILSLGRTYVLKCFLEIQAIFSLSDEPRYILNDLYITDYCVWIQSCSSKAFRNLAEHIKQVSIHKDDMKLDLLQTEYIASLTVEEHESSTVANLCSTMSSLVVKNRTDGSSNDATRDSDDSSSDSEDDSSSSDEDSDDCDINTNVKNVTDATK